MSWSVDIATGYRVIEISTPGSPGPAGEGLTTEATATLSNNQASPIDITGMTLAGFKSAMIHYLVQRVTTGAGAVQLIETGVLLVSLVNGSWILTETLADGDAGVEFSIDGNDIQYVTTNITGTPSISKINWHFMPLVG